MTKPLISLVGTAVRTHLWLEFYQSLRGNKVPLEVIFVGDKKPKFKLPRNIIYIYSTVKPAQCLEIAARSANGDLVAPVADDAFFGEKTIDNLYKLYEKINSDKAIISFRWFKHGKLANSNLYYYFIGDKSSPELPFSGLMMRNLWKHFGGIDRRFIASCGDTDLYLRSFEIGCKVYYCDNAIYEERKEKSGKRNLYPRYGQYFDRPLLDSFWVRKQMVSKKRLVPVKPFEENNILSVTQGNTGEWNNSMHRKLINRIRLFI